MKRLFFFLVGIACISIVPAMAEVILEDDFTNLVGWTLSPINCAGFSAASDGNMLYVKTYGSCPDDQYEGKEKILIRPVGPDEDCEISFHPVVLTDFSNQMGGVMLFCLSDEDEVVASMHWFEPQAAAGYGGVAFYAEGYPVDANKIYGDHTGFDTEYPIINNTLKLKRIGNKWTAWVDDVQKGSDFIMSATETISKIRIAFYNFVSWPEREIKVDFVKIETVTPYWCDDFEGYDPGSSASPPWHLSGNTPGVSVDNTVSYTGANSLKMYGIQGGCWAAIAAKKLEVEFPFAIELAMRCGTESLTGCHPLYNNLEIKTGPSWTDATVLQPFYYQPDGTLKISVGEEYTFPGFTLGEWHTFKVLLTLPGDGYLHAACWANNDFLGEYTIPEAEWMHHVSDYYLMLGGQEGTSWFDDVCVVPYEEPETYPNVLVVAEGAYEDKAILGKLIRANGLIPEFIENVPAELSQYCLIILTRYGAANPDVADRLRNFVANGGGVILQGAVPLALSTAYTNLASISDWFGATDYVNSNGASVLQFDNPLGSGLPAGTIVFNDDVNPCNYGASMTNLLPSATEIAHWEQRCSPYTTVFMNEYGLGRVYWSQDLYNFGDFGRDEMLELTSAAIRWAGSNCEGIWPPVSGSIYGRIFADDNGLPGVKVTLMDTPGNIVDIAFSDEIGNYIFSGVENGIYEVEVTIPLGFAPVTDPIVPVQILDLSQEVNFELDETAVDAACSNFWWWYKQFRYHQIGGFYETLVEFSEEDINNYCQAIFDHFYNRGDEFAIQIDLVTHIDEPARALTFQEMSDIFLMPFADDCDYQVRRSIRTILLNLASGRMSQLKVVSEDGATASQAFTYLVELYLTGEYYNVYTANVNLQRIHVGIMIPAGVIPPTTPNIMYRIDAEAESISNLMPRVFVLYQNYPNPFNPITDIRFDLPEYSSVNLEIFNVTGQKVATLANGNFEAGYHSVEWDASGYASGIYFYRIKADDFVETRKMTLLK